MKNLLAILTILITCFSCTEERYYTTTDTELKLDIIPFETTQAKYDYNGSDSIFDIYIYIGKVKSDYSSEVKNVDAYHLQINDLLTTSTEHIKELIDPGHGKASQYRINIIADKNTPEELLQKVEYRIAYEGWYKKKQIYYLENNLSNGTSGFNNQPTRIEHTSTVKFDKDEYISFVKYLVEDSLNYNWLYVHPVHIKMDIPLHIINDTNPDIQMLPSPSPPMLLYKLDSLSFSENQFDSIVIFRDEKVYQKGKRDSLFDYYGRGIIVSLPYSHKSMSEIFVDYEIVDWGWCGTGKYQTVFYTK